MLISFLYLALYFFFVTFSGMLKGINPIVSPDLLKTLSEMGHGDELLLSDSHFPGMTLCPKNVLRGDGLEIPDLLDGILPLFELDSYEIPLIMMAAPDVEAPQRIDRFSFYDRAEKAYACVITGTTAKYGNLIIKKGVTPIFE